MADQTRTCSLKRLDLVLLFLFGFSGPCAAAPPGAAAPTPLRAHVVHANQNRIYIAAQDSLALDAGTVLTFLDHEKPLATGEVLNIFEKTFLVARVTSGSLMKVKHLDRLTVIAEPPKIPATLRLGVPASGRANLLIACSRVEIDSLSSYQIVPISPREYRLTRTAAVANTPDTLTVRLFDDAADEEIALERGELDAAIFWPGEASAHIRDVFHWSGQPAGIRDQEVLRSTIPLAGLNQDLFRGDLVPTESTPDSSSGKRAVVDPGIPGHEALRQYLDRRATGDADRRDRIRLDTSRALETSDRVYLLRCPIICRPGFDRVFPAIDPNRLVNLIICAGGHK